MQRRLDYPEEPEHSTMRSILEIGLYAFALTVSALANAEELGRLFFTPEQRKQLDYNYAQGATSDNVGNALTLNGIVQKHGGKRTAWINGVPQEVGRDEQSPESVPVQLPGRNRSIKLKVGQRVLLGPPASPDTTATPNQGTPQQ
jgi:hypothetical protein